MQVVFVVVPYSMLSHLSARVGQVQTTYQKT